MLKTKLYGNPQKSKMYAVDVTPKGLIKSLKLWGPDRRVLLDGEIDHIKNPLKFSELKKEKGLEYILFLLYYPAEILKAMKGVPTKQLPVALQACSITNKQLVKNVLALRKKNEQNGKQLSRKRKAKMHLRTERKR